MRGAVSLAAALAIPADIDAGGGFPQRELIIFTVFCVIVLGLLIQGLTLPALIRATGLGRDEADEAADEARARAAAAEAALACLDEMGATKTSARPRICASSTRRAWTTRGLLRTSAATATASTSRPSSACARSCCAPSARRSTSSMRAARSRKMR